MSRRGQSPAVGDDGSRIALPSTSRSLDEEALSVQLRAYLEYRLRRVDPPPCLSGAWDRFYDIYTPQIRGFLRRFPLPEADREDCLQDVWSKVIVRLVDPSFDPTRARLSTWMLTIARNRAVDVLRRRRRPVGPIADASEIADARPGPADICDRLGEQERARIALSALSAEVSAVSFEVLYLRTIEGRTTAEVAASLHLTPEQVRLRLHRVRRKLLDVLENGIDAGRCGIEDGPPHRGEKKNSCNAENPRACNK